MSDLVLNIEWTEEHAQRLVEDPFELKQDEIFWIARQPYFESVGYQLRPRYRPGWVKSWTSFPDLDDEDSFPSTVGFDIYCRCLVDSIGF